jgi:ketosteroid isomerase-like protein
MRKMLLSLVAACVPAVAVAQGTQAAEAAIREHIAAHAAAITQRDAVALATLFTPDADEVIADGPRSIGRDAIRAAA